MAKTLTKSYQLLGSASTSTYSQLRLYGKYNSQNEATLKSNITLQLRLYGNGGSGSFSSGTARINSSSSSLGSTSFSKGKETTLKTLTYDVQHDSSGNYSASVSGFLHTTSGAMTDKTITQTIIVPQIKAKSKATATPNPADIGSTITINTNRVSNSYTHTLTYAFGSLSGTIGTNIGASTTWTIPTSFYAEIPDAALGTCVITCQTFNSSGTSLGTTTLNLMIQAFTPPIINSISYASTDALTLSLADSSTLISGVSTGTLSVNATAQNSATLSSVDFAIANNEIIGTDTSISGQTTATGTFSGTFSSPTIMAYVYDSRNNYAVSSNYSYTFIDYVQLSVDSGAILKRPAQTDDFVVIESYKGALWQGNFGQQTNSLTLKYRYKLHSDSDSSYSAWTTIPSASITLDSTNMTYSISNYQLPPTLSHTEVYDIQFQATDKIMTTEPYTYTIKLGIPNFAVFPNHLYFGNDYIFDSSSGSPLINPNCIGKNIITMQLTATQSFGNAYTKLNLSARTTIGTKLSVSSNQVRIGSGVNHIKVSATFGYNYKNAGIRYLRITKNYNANNLDGTTIAMQLNYETTANHTGTLAITDIVIPVNEGDLIGMYVYGLSGDSARQTTKGMIQTNMTIEVIS